MLQVALLKIPVSDLPRAVDFYEYTLGLEAVFTSDEFGWAQLAGAAVGIGLYVPGKGGGDAVAGSDAWFHLAHSDLAVLLPKIKERDPHAVITKNADASKSLDFRDPDGNTLRIMQSG